MIPRLPSIYFVSLFLTKKRFDKKYKSSIVIPNKKMNLDDKICYVRFNKIEEKVDINFKIKIKENAWRQFNLCRKPSETIEAVSNRIGINVLKVLNKVNKKKESVKLKSSDISFYDEDNAIISESKLFSELLNENIPHKVKIFETLLDVVVNPPWVVSISLPKTILAGFPIYPENFITQFTEKGCTEFIWYVGLPFIDKGNQMSEDNILWTLAGNNFFFTPSASDIGKKTKIKCIPGNTSFTGPPVEHFATNLIEAGPGECPFESRHKFTKYKLINESFRCVTYNILADLYCDSDYSRTVLHPYCPPYALQIDYRKQLIVKELLGYNADLICLQEVDTKMFVNCLEPLLGIEEFHGLFYKKGKEVAEGLSVFYRKDRFRFITDKQISLSQAISSENCFTDIWTAIKANQPLLDRFLDRSTVASATILESVDNPEHILIVGNTHLYFHPDADHIRLIQGGMYVYWIQQIKQELKEQMNANHISIIMCGDFNSVPSCGIYKLYTSGKVPSDFDDWKSNKKEAIQNLSLHQNLQLASACGTPQYTNFTAGFADCLDYIFYDTTTMIVEQVVPFPSSEDLSANTAIPSVVFPSDHIACIADLRLVKNKV